MPTANKKFAPKRWTVSFILFCFLLTQIIGGLFFYAKPAQAQLVVSDPITGAQTTVKNVKDFLKIVVVNGGMMALMNAASQFTQKIAYDLAVSLASGGGGEMPLFSTEGWGNYFENAALDAAGEFIGSFGDSLGVDFCAPPNPEIGLNIQLGLASIYGDEGPAPRCEWSDIQANWESFISEVQTEEFLSQMASQFRVGYGTGSNDMDLAITGFIGAFGARESATETAQLTREEGQGFLPLTELISGDVKTPAEMIRQSAEQTITGPADAESTKSISTSQALSAGAEGILMQFVSTFLNTLLSKSMDRLFSDGFYSLADLFSGSSGVRNEEDTALGGRKAAELAFADFLTPQIREGGMVDILTQFIVCPEKYRSQNNCVMDGQFEAAVRRAQAGEALTVSEAIRKNFLNFDWQLIPPSDTAKNQDPYCYTYGYCYSNLVKMRKARIIPIGWEIAAMTSTSDKPVSLGEVVSKFYDCNAEDKADSEHPYCHLIDPNWILKAPAEQCRAKVYGPVLQTAENSFRQETCVDSPTCIAEDDNGNCEGGWANCLREKNIWRLNGDKCEAQYDACRALKKSDGQTVSYLLNTIDNGPPCTSEDVGCRWYSTRQSNVADVWQWQDNLDGTGTDTRRTDRIFFNKNISQCDEPGCNEFLRTTKATKLNYTANSSFETEEGALDDGTGDIFTGWIQGTASPNNPPEAVSDTYFGQTALKLPSGGGNILKYSDIGQPVGGKIYTLSFYLKNASSTAVCASSSLTVYLGSIDSERPEPITGYWTGTSSNFPTAGADLSRWQRFNLSYTAPETGGHASDTVLAYRFYLGANCLIDAVQLEEGAMTTYHEGWSSVGKAFYLKSAPNYYSCYDYNSDGSLKKTNDAEECGNYTKACEEKDVGCEKFSPANGDPWIPGVANYPDDYCPAECVGYQTFKQVGTDFEQEKFPVYFISSSARACSAADAGCDQFTSLESEAVANFSSIRRCEKPGDNSATFYTWEGSDTAGYQLKTWNLKRGRTYDGTGASALFSPTGGEGPCTKLDPANPANCDDNDTVGKCTKADLETNPDCREFYDKEGFKHYRLYSKTIIATDDCHPYRKTISNESDCGISGGRWDDVKNECTYQVYLPETRVCSDAAVGCRAYRGNAGANVAVISNDNFDDGTLSGWTSGTASSESLTVGGKSLSVARDATTSKNVAGSVRKGGFYTLTFWAKGDSNLEIKFSSDGAGKEYFSDNNAATATPAAQLSFDWRYFSLGPVYVTWDPDADEKLEITPRGGTMSAVYLDNIVLREVQSYIYLVKNSWSTPASCDRTFLIDYAATNSANCSAAGGAWSSQTSECIVSAALPQAQLGCALYRDRSNRDHYLKSFSRLCSPDAAGCEKLIKTWNNAETGSVEFNTENDSDPSLSPEEQFSDNVKISADTFSFLIVDDAYRCKPENKGCADFGIPKLDASGNVKVEGGKPEYDMVSLLADPAKFIGDTGKILCEVQYQGCDEYATTGGGNLYFKDPGARTCEWKENITVEGRSVSGWFKKGTDPAEPCDPLAFYGGAYNIWKNGDIRCTLPDVCNNRCTSSTVCTSDTGCKCEVGGLVVCRIDKGQTDCGYGCPCSVGTTPGATGIAGSSCTVSYGKRTCPYSGWVGECPTSANMCTKYIDSADTSESEEGQAYYYIKNNKLTPGDCNGTVSRRDGCVLLNDTSITQSNYNANVTYASSEVKTGDPGGRVAPVDCSKTSSEGCKRCLDIKEFLVPIGGTGTGRTEYHWGDYCDASADCPSSYTEGCVAFNSLMILRPRTGELLVLDDLTGKNFEKNNTNTLLKVRRDRVCGEWLDCTSTNSTFDSQTGRQKTLCEELGVCSAYSKIGETTKCTEWVEPEENETSRKILTKDLYVSRDISWKGMEYSGDSIYNQYQAVDLRGINLGTDENRKLALAFIDDKCYGTRTAVDARTLPAGRNCDIDEANGTCYAVNGTPCGSRGKCYNNLCIVHFKGDNISAGLPILIDPLNAETASCRAYPEQSSPFPTTVVEKWNVAPDDYEIKSKKSGFTGANVCEKQKICVGGETPDMPCNSDADCSGKACAKGTEIGKSCSTDADCPGSIDAGRCAAGTCSGSDPEVCECGYKKVSYSGGSVTKYFAPNNDIIPKVCMGGPTPGKRCEDISDCNTGGGSGGQCIASQREDSVAGWQGYCLERDTSTSINGNPSEFACLTWYPIDQLPGGVDLYNYYTEAGFPLGDKYYCAETGIFRNLSPVGFHDAGDYECAELGDSSGCTYGADCWCDGDSDEAIGACKDNINQCDPANDFALLTKCEYEGWCVDDYGDNDCPYRCVPLNSRRVTSDPATDGTLCTPPASPRRSERADNGLLVYYVDDLRGTYETYKDCVREGGVEEGAGYRKYASHSDPFVGCKSLYQVAGNSWSDRGGANIAWTNRTWQSGGYTVKGDPYQALFGYVYRSVLEPFGRSLSIEDGNFLSIPTCRKTSEKTDVALTNADLSCPTGYAKDPEESSSGEFTVPNEVRGYNRVIRSPITGTASCSTDADCNANWICGNVTCYKECLNDSDCGTLGSCLLGAGGGRGRCATGTDLANPNYTGDLVAECNTLAGYSPSAPVGVCKKIGGVTTANGCIDHGFCRSYQCVSGQCVTTGTELAGRTEEEDSSKALERIKQIFASRYNLLIWNSLGAVYEGDPAFDPIFDTSKSGTPPGPDGSSWPISPQVYALGDCIGEKCKQGISGITVNGIDGNGLTSGPAPLSEPTETFGYDGRLNAVIQFFGRADRESMPIRKIVIDWNGDGFQAADDYERSGLYKNHLGLKDDNSPWCDNTDFGRSDQACTDRYFMYTHIYSCSESDVGESYYRLVCPEDVNGAADGNGSCCVFQPRVQIKDNWGWCNGSCPGGEGGIDSGCYDASDSGRIDECSMRETSYNHWTSFQGQVIVVPK